MASYQNYSLATYRTHEFLSERSELIRPQSGQPSDEESNEGLFWKPISERAGSIFEVLNVEEGTGHFRVPKTLMTRLNVKPFLGKWFLFAWELKTHLLSLAFKQRLGQLGNGPLDKIAPPSGYQRAILEDVL